MFVYVFGAGVVVVICVGTGLAACVCSNVFFGVTFGAPGLAGGCVLGCLVVGVFSNAGGRRGRWC